MNCSLLNQDVDHPLGRLEGFLDDEYRHFRGPLSWAASVVPATGFFHITSPACET